MLTREVAPRSIITMATPDKSTATTGTGGKDPAFYDGVDTLSNREAGDLLSSEIPSPRETDRKPYRLKDGDR